ncbi:hypothetical protein [Streptomyces sp. NPDC001070]
MDGPPSEVWSAHIRTYYDMEILDEEQVAQLRAAFLERAAELAAPDGRIP